MEIINKLEINRHEIIKERGKHFIKSLSGDDKKTIMSIVKKSEDYLKNIGNQDNVVYSPTKRELATFDVSFKRYIRTDFIDPAILRIKPVETWIEDIDGICERCKSHSEEYMYEEYDLCDSCSDKVDYASKLHSLQWERIRIIEREFDKAVENTKVPDELKGNWLILMRKMREDKESKHLDNVLKEFIRDELVKEFVHQNQPIIKKYNL